MGLETRVWRNTHGERRVTPVGYPGKRLLDLMGGLLLSAVTLPVVVVMALVSAARFRCWPFFVQEREGFDGETFSFIKIRSLPRDTPAYVDREHLDDVARCRWGDFIRNRHLDEIPQFWLVVSGKMSLVGPRPMIHSICERMPGGHRRRRNAARPGVTGLWQISEDNARLVLEATHYDEHYVQASHLRLDLWVMAATTLQVIGRPRIQPGDMPDWVREGLGFRDTGTRPLGAVAIGESAAPESLIRVSEVAATGR